MLNSEKQLEDYICDNIDKFKRFLKTLYKDDQNVKEINFIGRQIYLNGYYADLVFDTYYKNKKENIEIRTFIVVELKNRELKPDDISQLCKYLNLIENSCLIETDIDYEIETKGILLGVDLDNNMQDIQMYLEKIDNRNKIKFCGIKTDISYYETNYSYRDEYIINSKYDERLKLNV